MAVGTIRPTDDADGGRLLNAEVKQAGSGQTQRAQQGRKYAELSGSTEKERLRVRKQRPEVRHRPHPHEDDERESAGLDTHHVNEVQQPITGRDLHAGNVG